MVSKIKKIKKIKEQRKEEQRNEYLRRLDDVIREQEEELGGLVHGLDVVVFSFVDPGII